MLLLIALLMLYGMGITEPFVYLAVFAYWAVCAMGGGRA
jgi:hypothetical protein